MTGKDDERPKGVNFWVPQGLTPEAEEYLLDEATRNHLKALNEGARVTEVRIKNRRRESGRKYGLNRNIHGNAPSESELATVITKTIDGWIAEHDIDIARIKKAPKLLSSQRNGELLTDRILNDLEAVFGPRTDRAGNRRRFMLDRRLEDYARMYLKSNHL